FWLLELRLSRTFLEKLRPQLFRPRLEGKVCAPRSEASSRRQEDFQSNPICEAETRLGFAGLSSGCRSAVDVRVELRQRDLLVEHKLREDEPARGDLKGHHEREVALAGIVRGAAGDFRHRHLTRVVGNDGGYVVARQANPDHLALRVPTNRV